MKTTAKHFAEFKTAVGHWQTRLGLRSWKFYFEHTDLPDDFATTYYRVEGRVATFQLTTSWDKRRPLTWLELRRLAKHEVLHVLLAELYVLAKARFTTNNEMDRAEHAVVVTLENVLPDA